MDLLTGTRTKGPVSLLLVALVFFLSSGPQAVAGPYRPAAGVEGSAGLHPSTAAWLHERGVAVFGDEGGTDTMPTAVEGINSPMHVLALVAMGMPLIENLDLEELAAEATAQDRWTFMFVLAPLHVRGATGSPANPLAIF